MRGGGGVESGSFLQMYLILEAVEVLRRSCS